MERNPKVLIGTITYDSDWYCLKQFAESMVLLNTYSIDTKNLIIDNSDSDSYMKQLEKFFPHADLKHYQPPKDKVGFERFRHCEIKCRQMVVNYFLQKDFDYLFFVDSDVICLPGVLAKLLSNNKDICCGLFRYRDPPQGRPLWFRKKHPPKISEKTGVWDITFIENGEVDRLKEPLEIDACGFGAILISREALKGTPLRKSKNDHYGADINFCFDAKEKGFKIFADASAKCKHLYKQCARRRDSNARAF